MSPLWSILQDHLRSGEQRPIRFFYGARSVRDLFYLDAFKALEEQLPDFRFISVLSHHDGGEDWVGETGLVHDVATRLLRASPLEGEIDAYACGPPPMIDAVCLCCTCSGWSRSTSTSISSPRLRDNA